MQDVLISRRTLVQFILATAAPGLLGCDRDGVSLERKAQRINRETGVQIGFGPPSSFFVPPYSVIDGLFPGSIATRCGRPNAALAADTLLPELQKYPPGFFAAHCPAIFLCGSLTMDGANAGGTYGPKWIILVVGDGDSLSRPVIRETVRLGVHHEFSSVLFAADEALRATWQAMLPANWTAPPSDHEALQAYGVQDPPPETGFLTAYAATSAENDFNTYAETLFTEPDKLRRLAKKHKLVARKLALIAGVYYKKDARFLELLQRLGLRLPITSR